MNEEILLTRRRVSRRRALALGGSVSLAGLLAACGGDDDGAGSSASETATAKTSDAPAATGSGAEALLDDAPTCVMSAEQTQGPYWFDVDSIREDVREKRPGTRLDLALRVQDLSACERGGDPAPVSNAVVEIWHCDAGGVYSGFESGAGGGPPPGPGGSSGGTSNGSYSVGDQEAQPQDDATFLRGAQPTDRAGVARFTTIYPGWYQGRTVHIHLKAHVDKRTILTTQLYFDEKVNDAVFATSPYDERGDRDTLNSSDGIFDRSGVMLAKEQGDRYLAAINLGVNV